MIDLVRLLFALMVPILIGYIFITFISSDKLRFNIFEHLSLSFLIGSGIITLEMLILGLVGIKFTILSIMTTSLIVCAFPLYRSVKNMTFSPNFIVLKDIRSLSLLELFFAVMIILRVSFSFFEALIKPVITVDAYANWCLRAKVFFVSGGLSLVRDKGYFLGGGQIYYPIHVPLLESWTFVSLGYWNDLLIKIIFPLFFLALLLIIYYSLRKRTNRLVALIGTYFLSSLPMLLYHSTIEYCDLPLAVYFTASIILLLDYIDTKEPSYLFISSILAGIGMWTKSEGLPLFCINLLILLVASMVDKKKDVDLIPFVKYLFVALIFKLPWQLVNMIYKIPKSIWQKIEINKAAENLDRVPIICQQMYQKFFFYGNWNIAWFTFLFVIVLSLIFTWSKRKIFSLAAVLLCLIAFFFTYYITPSYTWLLDGTTLNRNMLILMPMLIYFVSLCINDILFSSNKYAK